jgi:NAD(P)-dependent dehydrogenase (short-subunit alcohol dehydrogenase family)
LDATFHSRAFAGQSVLVVGGTTGIGAAAAAAFAALGGSVTVTGATAAECATARSAPMFACRAAVPLDVRHQDAIDAVIGELPQLHVLVNCAGIIRRGEEHAPAVFDEVVAVNLSGTMRCCAAARAKLAQSRGAVVNIASVLSFFGGGLVPGYAASKGGVAQLTKSLAIAYAGEGVRVNAVAPGWVATPFTQALQDDRARSEAIVKRTPLARWAQPDDIAGAIVFLCTPAASFITGVVLPVDGGYMIA